jgi:hypothetical protein
MKKKYMIAEGWSHIFAGNTASDTRWVLDVPERKLVAGFIRQGSYWHPLVGYPLLDLQEDVEHNVLWALDDGFFEQEYEGFNLLRTNKLPAWALSPREAHAD